MGNKTARPHLPTIAAVLLLSGGFILLGLMATSKANAQHECPVTADAAGQELAAKG